MPKEKTISLLQEALSSTSADVDDLIERLALMYRDEKEPKSTEQVVALGFLACARALREASLIQEIAIREETQDLGKLIVEVLDELRRTERGPTGRQRTRRLQQARSLAADLDVRKKQ